MRDGAAAAAVNQVMAVPGSNRFWLGLGSNLDDPASRLDEATQFIAGLDRCRLLGRSVWFGSRAWGVVDQADFVNGCVLLETDLSPLSVLLRMQAIERRMGRVRKRHWGERVIDIDVLLDQRGALTTPSLVLPHPWLEQRAFVLAPLADLSPGLILPSGTAVETRLAELVSGEVEPPYRGLDLT